MNDLHAIALGTYATQSVGGALIAFVLFVLWRQYRREHLKHWGISFVCLVAYLVGATFAMLFARDYAPAHPLRLSVSTVSMICGYAQPAWMLIGTLELARGRTVPARTIAWVLAIVVVLALTSTFGTLGSTPDVRLFVRVGIRGLVAAIGFVGTATVVARLASPAARVGRTLVVTGLSLYTLTQLFYFTVNLVPLFTPFSPAWAWYVGFGDIACQVVVGLGLVSWHLEEERETSLRASEALRRSAEELHHSQRLEVVGRLAGGIAHDFNNVLTAVFGYSDLLRAEVGHQPKARAWLDELDLALGRAQGLTGQLLAFVRKQTLAPRVLDLTREVASRETMLGRVVEPLIRLQLDLPEQSVPVRIDPAQVEQILLNLVLNARDAMPCGGQLRIALAHRTLDDAEARAASIAPGEYALLSVEDSGTGMSEETQRHLFEPFFTTKQHGQGTGLGLATVYASVTQLGGTIRVASELGRGTRFTILLPRSPRAAEESEPVVEVRPHARRAGESRRVLLVEDQAEVRQVVREALERDGFDVVAAQDGLAAVAEFDAPGARFDLLLTDVVMPGLRGDELARALRRRNRDLKIVAMTAYARPRDGEPEIVIDGARWIAKPFTPRDIVEAVRAELGEASQRLPASSSR